MGQNSSVAVGTPKENPGNRRLIVDASDSFVSSIKLLSTGIIPISEYIKKEKCSKNIQKVHDVKTNYHNTNNPVNKLPKENLRPKKLKADFIETSFEDIPTRRQWVRNDFESKKIPESDALKIGLNKLLKNNINRNEGRLDTRNVFRERCPELGREYCRERSREGAREVTREGTRNGIRECSRNGIRECSRNGIREDARPKTRRGNRESIGVGTREVFFNKDTYQEINNQENPVGHAKKQKVNKDQMQQTKFYETSFQTITKDIGTSYEDVKQLYKRRDFDEKKRYKNNLHDRKEPNEKSEKEENKSKQQKQQQQQQQQQQQRHHKMKTRRDLEEESTHQFQTHEISRPKHRSKKYGENLNIETNLSCTISPNKYLQWQIISNENQLERRTNRQYLNRKLAGEYYDPKETLLQCKDTNSLSSSNVINNPTTSLLPSASTLEQVIKERRKNVSAKEALENWKNVHIWKQHKKRFERSRNQFMQDNLDATTQTTSQTQKNCIGNKCRNDTNRYQETHWGIQDHIILPSEKHMNKDFILKMEHCLKKHSTMCAVNSKRNGDGKFTWVQDKYRRWHKITFDDFKK